MRFAGLGTEIRLVCCRGCDTRLSMQRRPLFHDPASQFGSSLLVALLRIRSCFPRLNRVTKFDVKFGKALKAPPTRPSLMEALERNRHNRHAQMGGKDARAFAKDLRRSINTALALGE